MLDLIHADSEINVYVLEGGGGNKLLHTVERKMRLLNLYQ